jgi:dethiobiotin synthetase
MALQGLFVTGTDTGVGKTFVATAIIQALRAAGVRVGAYKPAVSGSRNESGGPIWDDVAQLQAALGTPIPPEILAPQRFRAALSPPAAARLEGMTVDSQLLRTGIDYWQGRADFVVVEGAGGILSPITDSETVADLARDLAFPLIVVARLGLGTINHTLLTLEAARSRRLSVAGIVLNQSVPPDPADPSPLTNPADLLRLCDVPIVAIVPHTPTPGLLHNSPLSTIDWRALARQSGA